MKFNCQYLQICSGCSFKKETFQEQTNFKKKYYTENFLKHLKHSSPDIQFVFPVEGYHRHRSDFIITGNQVCLYDQEKRLLPVNECSLLSPELLKLLQIVSTTPFNLQGKGTIRLRVSPSGKYGVWLDFSNLEIKRLLDDQTALIHLLDYDISIEIGQKGKSLAKVDGKLKLLDPNPNIWFNSFSSGKVIGLFSLISSFTQPSFTLNQQMLEEIDRFIPGKNSRFKNLIEFGAGVGNFSLFLSDFCERLYLIENDPRNLVALERNILENALKEKTEIITNDKCYKDIPRDENNLIFVNPPKSGVGKLFDLPIIENKVIYVSCYLESMKRDLDKLFLQGFRLKKSVLFDQFPQSHHFETLSYLERN